MKSNRYKHWLDALQGKLCGVPDGVYVQMAGKNVKGYLTQLGDEKYRFDLLSGKFVGSSPDKDHPINNPLAFAYEYINDEIKSQSPKDLAKAELEFQVLLDKPESPYLYYMAANINLITTTKTYSRKFKVDLFLEKDSKIDFKTSLAIKDEEALLMD